MRFGPFKDIELIYIYKLKSNILNEVLLKEKEKSLGVWNFPK